MARGFSYAPGASPDVLEASSENIPRERLLELGASSNKVVREAVGRREDCPLGLLVTLAHDHVVPVRVAVAANPIASRTVMAYLSADRSADVLEGLLTNPNLPADLLGELAFHKKSSVRKRAAARLNAPDQASAAMEDVHTPELRDRAFSPRERTDTGGAEVVSITTGEAVQPRPTAPEAEGLSSATAPNTAWTATGAVAEVPAAAASVLEEPATVTPTRTAPVRGFRPPSTA
ncbi:hypothetical protein [Demequina aurantiaca]|uniref:hypothetical protein n=1 Tax=Demequina aurantiaca TaxID=676200 RepID=UPI000B01D31C|nr:hypothetical protein [Demequina aurantiaca]